MTKQKKLIKAYKKLAEAQRNYENVKKLSSDNFSRCYQQNCKEAKRRVYLAQVEYMKVFNSMVL